MTVVAITGVSGYIGRTLAAQFDMDDEIERIIGIDVTPPPAPVPMKMKFYRRSVTESLDDIFKENEIDMAVHLAFIVDPIHNKKQMLDVNIGGTKNFLKACSSAGTKTVCVVSSSTAYGAREDNPFPIYEGTELRAEGAFPYAQQKVLQEEACYDWIKDHRDPSFIIVRPSIVIGPNVQNFISRYMEKNTVLGVKGYNPPMQFVHEDDLTLVIYRLMKSNRAGIFNVGGDGAVRLSEVAHLMKKRILFLPRFVLKFFIALGWLLRIRSITEAPPGMLEYVMYPWVVHNAKVKNEILYSFRYSSKGALLDYIEARAHGAPALAKT